MLVGLIFDLMMYLGIYNHIKLNYKSECTIKYKKGVILNMLHRAYKIASSEQIFITETNWLKQLFTNNNYLMNNVLHWKLYYRIHL